MKRIISILLIISFPIILFSQNNDGPPLPCVKPNTQASSFTATATSSSTIDLAWTRGDGDNVIILAHRGAVVDADPESGTSYTANAAFGSGTQIGTGNYVVYIGTGTAETVTTLTGETTYHFTIYEFNNTDVCYLIPGVSDNATTPAAAPNITNVAPDNFFADKGTQLTITGSYLGDMTAGTTVTIASVTGTKVSNDGSTLVVDFPAGLYINNTLTVSTGVNPDATETVTVNTRNVIPVGVGTDFHNTIQSALDGLFAWFGTATFSLSFPGYLAGTKTIDVYNGTYTDEVTPNITLGTTASENLIIQNHAGENPVINAASNNYGFYIGELDYVQIIGFTVHTADIDIIYTEGDNNTISYNRCYGSVGGTGIMLNTAASATVTNNLVYNNNRFGARITSSNNVIFRNNTLADNGNEAKGPPLPGPYLPAQFYVESGTGTNVTNNIFYAKTGSNVLTLMTEPGITVTSNYNTYFKNANNNLVYYNGTLYTDMAAWTGNGAGTNDLENDPQFVTNGSDFHISSVYDSYHAGEWPPSTATTGTWTADATTSPALDTGNPLNAFANEPVSGDRINQGAYGNTVQASKSGGIRWDGSESTDWQNVANWTPEQIPTSTDDITIPDGCPNYPIIDDLLTAECNNVIIEALSNVEIAQNGKMTVSGTVANNAGAAGIVVKSDILGDGSLIINTSAISATVERYLSHTNGEDGQWHFLGSPVDAAPVSLFNTNNFYAYDESQDDWWTGADYSFNGTSGWFVPAGNLNVGQGYIYYFNELTLNFQGAINHNDAGYDLTVGYTVHAGNAVNGIAYTNFDGWALLSNPHPCALDWLEIDKSDDIGMNVYYYDDAISNYKYYIDNGDGTGSNLNGGSQYIPSGQGFFVKSQDVVDGGILTIPNAAKLHNDQTYWKNSKPIENFLKLRMDYSGYYDETVVMLKKDASSDFDDKFDAYKRFSWSDDVIQIYTFNPGIDIEYAVNSVFGNDELVIPLAYKVNFEDQFTIYSNEFNFDNYNVYLHDIEKEIFIELSLNQRYSFKSEAGIFKNRFEIIFEKNNSVNINEFNESNVNVYPNPSSGIFNIHLNNQSEKYRIEISSVTANVIYKSELINSKTHLLDISSYSSGIYFLKLIFENNREFNRKIIIK